MNDMKKEMNYNITFFYIMEDKEELNSIMEEELKSSIVTIISTIECSIERMKRNWKATFNSGNVE